MRKGSEGFRNHAGSTVSYSESPAVAQATVEASALFVRFILKGRGRASGSCLRELNAAAREQAERNGI